MRRREQGSAMIIVLVAIAAMLTSAAVLVHMTRGTLNSVSVHRDGLTGLYCAEAGLSSVKPTVIANVGSWNSALGTGTEPAWLGPVSHDVDGDGTSDFTVTLRDNDDEAVNDPSTDSDSAVFVVSTCTKYPDSPTQVTELITSTGQRKLWLRTE
jgi:hypothetical protein